MRTLQRNFNTQYYYHILQFQRKDLVEQEMLEKTSSFQNDKLEFVKNPVIAEFLGLSFNIDFLKLIWRPVLYDKEFITTELVKKMNDAYKAFKVQCPTIISR